jgi:hypothetical protein
MERNIEMISLSAKAVGVATGNPVLLENTHFEPMSGELNSTKQAP